MAIPDSRRLPPPPREQLSSQIQRSNQPLPFLSPPPILCHSRQAIVDDLSSSLSTLIRILPTHSFFFLFPPEVDHFDPQRRPKERRNNPGGFQVQISTTHSPNTDDILPNRAAYLRTAMPVQGRLVLLQRPISCVEQLQPGQISLLYHSLITAPTSCLVSVPSPPPFSPYLNVFVTLTVLKLRPPSLVVFFHCSTSHVEYPSRWHRLRRSSLGDFTTVLGALKLRSRQTGCITIAWGNRGWWEDSRVSGCREEYRESAGIGTKYAFDKGPGTRKRRELNLRWRRNAPMKKAPRLVRVDRSPLSLTRDMYTAFLIQRALFTFSPSTTTMPSMFLKAANLNLGEAAQVNTSNYHNLGTTNVNEGGQHSENIQINAAVYNKYDFCAVDPLRDLYQHIAIGAMHNSDDRAEAPKCHKETRKAVQENIFSWIASGDTDDGQPKQLLWLTGPAGGGKTAIMGSVSDVLEENGQLAASFYFASYTNSVERMSKRHFVTTLAYQLQAHRAVKARIAELMMSAIRQHPAILKMNLREQMEKLILSPLRESKSFEVSTSGKPLIIAVDGVDECGEPWYYDPGRSREKDQLEVLSVLLQAARDPAFPFKIIIASRPENWIRHFFNETCDRHVEEIFLDNKFQPDDDIRLFLESKFSELSRRYCLPPTWPGEASIKRLVANASGQFIYAATVMRFIDAPPRLPQVSLNIVLKLQSSAGFRPFNSLDKLYTAILKASPSPSETVLWLKALQLIAQGSMIIDSPTSLSAWTADRLFESGAGQAQLVLLGIPSLLYLAKKDVLSSAVYDFHFYADQISWPSTPLHPPGSNAGYSFYHRSFLDFLQDPARCEAAFPDIGKGKVEHWLWERISTALKCAGPEVPQNPDLSCIFKKCFTLIWAQELLRSRGRMTIPESILSSCDPTFWLDMLPSVAAPEPTDLELHTDVAVSYLARAMFLLVHKNCHFYRPCSPGCKLWRKAMLSTLPSWTRGSSDDWNSKSLLLDRFGMKSIKFESHLSCAKLAVIRGEPTDTLKAEPVEQQGPGCPGGLSRLILWKQSYGFPPL
ncbi:hypothetical protein NMY22_g11617 [Coprinellus aureogranulatus]|nr:hypothetical protein NMY22_g11617 [Coprinellus aureogranulatus]